MRKIRVLTLFLLAVLLLPAALHSATLNEVLASSVRADTYYGKDIDISQYEGIGTFILSADKAGSGITAYYKIQNSLPASISSLNDTGTDTPTWVALLDDVATDTKIAVQWTQATVKQIKYAYLYLKQVGTVSGNLTVDVEANNAGAPSDSALVTSAAVDASTISTTGEWVRFTFAIPYDLSAAIYHLVLKGTYTGSATNHISVYTSTVGSDGTLEVNNGSWVDTTTKKVLAMGLCYNFTDVAGGAFTNVTNTAASFQNIQKRMTGLKSVIRAVAGNSGTATGASCIVLYGVNKYEP